jgi:hypothetical protein
MKYGINKIQCGKGILRWDMKYMVDQGIVYICDDNS